MENKETKVKDEYDVKKISLAIFALVFLVGAAIFGLNILRDQQFGFKGSAAGPSCPEEGAPITCRFTVDGDLIDFRITMDVAGGEPILIPSDDPTIQIEGNVISVTRNMLPVANENQYTCLIEFGYLNQCTGEETPGDEEKTITCDVPDGGDPSETPSPSASLTPRTSPICEDCTKVQLSVHLGDDDPIPSLTPPNINEKGLKYGRVKIKITDNACKPDDIKCAKIDETGKVVESGLKIEWVAFKGATCGDPKNELELAHPTPANKDNLLLSCEDALKEDEGARFRLHQGGEVTEDNPEGCRCYQLTQEWVVAEGDDTKEPKWCPNEVEQTVCCPECKPHEIIDLGNDDVAHGGDIDGCPGDPDDPDLKYPVPPAPQECYFAIKPKNACPRVNSRIEFETHNGGVDGTLDYDDDFRESRESVPGGTTEFDYVYRDGGTYDIRLECKDADGKVIASCTKRVRTSCEGPGGGTGSPPPPSPTGGSCPLPEITGTCIEPTQTP